MRRAHPTANVSHLDSLWTAPFFSIHIFLNSGSYQRLHLYGSLYIADSPSLTLSVDVNIFACPFHLFVSLLFFSSSRQCCSPLRHDPYFRSYFSLPQMLPLVPQYVFTYLLISIRSETSTRLSVCVCVEGEESTGSLYRP